LVQGWVIFRNVVGGGGRKIVRCLLELLTSVSC
jgi:hypothetical protein